MIASEQLTPTSLVLVAVMNDPRDLEIARLLGWYRIPLRSAPKVIAVDFLAFYQTAAFELDKWRIQYIAPVRGHELTTRGELLRDEPAHPHAHQEYFKVQIGDLQRLKQPVKAGEWRRITFLYTTGERLLQAHNINDLVVAGEERPLLWQALRERMTHDQPYGHPDSQPVDPALDVDLRPEVLAALLGILPARESDGDCG